MVQKLYFDGGAAVALSVPRCTLRYYIILLGSVSVQVWMEEYDEICGNIGVPAVFRLVSALEATPCWLACMALIIQRITIPKYHSPPSVGMNTESPRAQHICDFAS